MVHTLGLICWLEKVLLCKSEAYASKYILKPLLCQNIVDFTPISKLGTHQDLAEPVYNSLKTERFQWSIFSVKCSAAYTTNYKCFYFKLEYPEKNSFFLFFENIDVPVKN